MQESKEWLGCVEIDQMGQVFDDLRSDLACLLRAYKKLLDCALISVPEYAILEKAVSEHARLLSQSTTFLSVRQATLQAYHITSSDYRPEYGDVCIDDRFVIVEKVDPSDNQAS